MGEYPFNIEERFDKLVIHFKAKQKNSLGGTVLNLQFKIKDKSKRNRIKEIADELSKIDK